MKIVNYRKSHNKDAIRDSLSIKQAIDDYLESEDLYLQILDEDDAVLVRRSLVNPFMKEK